MPAPVIPSDFETLLPTANDTICDALSKASQFDAAFYALFAYMFKEDGTLGDDFAADICAIGCLIGPETCPTTTTTTTYSGDPTTTTTSTTVEGIPTCEGFYLGSTYFDSNTGVLWWTAHPDAEGYMITRQCEFAGPLSPPVYVGLTTSLPVGPKPAVCQACGYGSAPFAVGSSGTLYFQVTPFKVVLGTRVPTCNYAQTPVVCIGYGGDSGGGGG